MKRAIPTLLLLPALCAADPSRSSVERLLSGFETAGNQGDFERLGSGVDQVLLTIAADPGTSGVRRLRALGALRFVPSAAGRAYCHRVIADEKSATEGAQVLEVGACARALGASRPVGVTERTLLVSLLSHPASDVRIGAALGLEAARQPEVAAALRARLVLEPDEDIRAVLGRTLQALPRR